MVVQVQLLDPATYIISASKPRYEGLVVHGYGSNKEEILGLSVVLAAQLNLRLLAADLPGHGCLQQTVFNLKNSCRRLAESLKQLSQPVFFIGHSIGARLGLMLGLPLAVCISLPGRAFFEGNQRELVRILRYRRVREKAPYQGLQEILAVEVQPAKKMLLLTATQELKSVKELADNWLVSPFAKGLARNNLTKHTIKNCSHLDIISQPETSRVIALWLKQQLG